MKDLEGPGEKVLEGRGEMGLEGQGDKQGMKGLEGQGEKQGSFWSSASCDNEIFLPHCLNSAREGSP